MRAVDECPTCGCSCGRGARKEAPYSVEHIAFRTRYVVSYAVVEDERFDLLREGFELWRGQLHLGNVPWAVTLFPEGVLLIDSNAPAMMQGQSFEMFFEGVKAATITVLE